MGNQYSGRRPEPTKLKMLRGNPGKRKPNLNEPQPPILQDLTPPRWLTKPCKKEWRRLAPMLARLGVLTETDRDTLAAYCDAWVRWKAAAHQVHTLGMVIPSDPIPVVSPWVKVANDAMTQIRSLLVELGMTPRLTQPHPRDP